ncbi:hypothetical protein [Pseudoalteromonas rhizosphaerae]|uniref:hypothetical protein n=1 Tax=Pseudoalteromonas rhizosphaerae TaxID=2518973 RepID=UPI00384BB042
MNIITKQTLPDEFKPLYELNICSNKLKGGANLLAIGEVIPLLIGKGKIPQVWLLAISDTSSDNFVPIVVQNVSKFSSIKVNERKGEVIVSGPEGTIVAVKNTGNSSATVSNLNLSSLGISIYGKNGVLHVGSSTFSKNSITGGGALIGLPAIYKPHYT